VSVVVPLQAPPGRRPRNIPRVALTLAEAAEAVGISESTFRRYVLPELRIVAVAPGLTLVRVAELDRFLQLRQAIGQVFEV
jgi:hypothetical protein